MVNPIENEQIESESSSHLGPPVNRAPSDRPTEIDEADETETARSHPWLFFGSEDQKCWLQKCLQKVP